MDVDKRVERHNEESNSLYYSRNYVDEFGKDDNL
jgi:hypothetical protein